MTTVRLSSLANAGVDKKKFAENAVMLLETIVNNRHFQDKVMNANYSGRKFRRDDGLLIDADNAFILQQIITGKEYKTQPDDEITLKAKIGLLGRRTVGRVKPPDPLITTNTLFFNEWFKGSDTLSLAAHWMHEWLHVSGFRHTTENPDSNDVNYLTGTFVVETGKQMAILFSEKLAAEQGEGYAIAYRNVFKCNNFANADTVRV